MPRLRDPARAERERMLRLERQALARAEARAVEDGVAETVALSRARGAAIVQAESKRRAQPYRRQPGLEWLASKGRISAAEKAAGERYGAAYRRAKLDPSIPSTLAIRPGGARPGGPALTEILSHGDGTHEAQRRLAGFRARLLNQVDLIGVCDVVCGLEQTPREAAGGDRDAGRLEAVLKVALDILAGA